MKIKLYVITYNNSIALNACLESLYSSIIPNDVILEKYIINNHSNFSMNEKYNDIKVLHNDLRPDFSTGYLARNWNQCIINGFKDLNNPDCDILATCQVDTIFAPNWIEKLIEFHKQYSLITACPGDGFVSYTVDAIKNIGLWDERFCSIEYQEADYFLRALNYNKNYSSINDFNHGRILNKILPNEWDKSFVYRENTDYVSHEKATKWGSYNLKLLYNKYNIVCMTRWDDDFIRNPPKPAITNYIIYPYFEKDVIDLNKKYFY